jgi:hypothetical protein
MLFCKFTHSANQTNPYQTIKSDKGQYHHHNRWNDIIKLQKFTILADSYVCNLCTLADVNGSSFMNFVTVCADYFETLFTRARHLRRFPINKLKSSTNFILSLFRES